MPRNSRLPLLVIPLAIATGARTAAAGGDEVAPVQATASGYVAAFGYVNHPERHEGGESQIRVDVWRALDWAGHFAYTVDVVNLTSLLDSNRTTTPFQDMNLGGSGGFHLGNVPMWAFGELHGLVGNTGYGTGEAAYGGVGAAWREIHAELGVGGVAVSDNRGLSVDLKISRARLTPWLDLAGVLLYTDTSPTTMTAAVTGGSRVAAGGEITLGPFERTTVVVDGLVGDRALALTNRGMFVENLVDVQHAMVRGFVWLDFSARVRGYVGLQLRTASAPADAAATMSSDYVLVSGFAGGHVTF